jgi:hypothetical protein
MNRSLLLIFMLSMGSPARAQSAPTLASAQGFAVLGATTVTNTGATPVKGDLGVSPGTAVTGFPPGTVTGGTIHAGDATAAAAHADADTAYAALVAQPCGTNLSGLILGTSPGAVTLTPGVYCFGATAQLTGTLTLSGNGVYIFQIGSTLTTATNSSVVLTNGAMAANVFWQVGTSATIGTGTVFVGSILAEVSDTVNTGASVDGRIFALTGAVTLDTNAIIAAASGVGRWEIVHTSGDNSAQTAAYPGGFSTFLTADEKGNTFGTFTDSLCVGDSENFNIVPTWVALGGNVFQITIAVDNLGRGQNFSFIYNGTYDFHAAVPGDPSLSIPAITGTYFATGDISACSVATPGSPGNFVATFLPTISSGSATGSLDGFTDDHGFAFDSPVSATITFSAPPASGQIAGTVSLGSNPTFHSTPCFATTSGAVTPLIINPNKSNQSGTSEYMFAEGLDPQGTPTTLFLNGFSANLYTSANTDRNATPITTTEWAVASAIGEDNPAAGTTGVSNDGTNSVIVVLYGVLGGACSNAGGVDAPFYFLSGTPVVHKHRERRRRGNRAIPHRENHEDRED